MTRRDWWLGLVVLVVAGLLHALLPRYEIVGTPSTQFARFDRWTGQLQLPNGRHTPWLTFYDAKR